MMNEIERSGNDTVQEINKTINRVCVGWESTIHELPEFKKGDCAGDMTMGLKTTPLLGDDELKQKAAQRKAESDQILELVYDRLKKGYRKQEEVNN